MNVAITGASGFIGRAVAEHLQKSGHTVRAVSLRAALPDHSLTSALAGSNAVIHLAGEPVAQRWTEQDLLEKAATDNPLLIILDLNANGVDAVDLIRKVKANPDLKRISLIGFLSHVQGELKIKAQDAGATMAMARPSPHSATTASS